MVKTLLVLLGLLATGTNIQCQIQCFGKEEIDWPTDALTDEEISGSINHHFALEGDDPSKFLIYNGFIVNFEAKRKAPLWTTHKLTFAQVDKNRSQGVNRQKYCIEFKQDPNNVGLSKQAHHNDYSNTGFDRGHMTPAGDFYVDSLGTLETFYITNVTPQTPDFNQVVMVAAENKIRGWVRRNRIDCQVITGAIYADRRGRGITKKKIDVPSHFYKIVYAVRESEHLLFAFLFPHKFAYSDFNLIDYQVTVDVIEKFAKEDFLDVLSDEVETRIESRKEEISIFLD